MTRSLARAMVHDPATAWPDAEAACSTGLLQEHWQVVRGETPTQLDQAADPGNLPVSAAGIGEILPRLLW